MKKVLTLYLILFSFIVFSKTAEEHYKDAETYSQKSKQNYIFAGAALVFVIAVRYINKKSNNKEK